MRRVFRTSRHLLILRWNWQCKRTIPGFSMFSLHFVELIWLQVHLDLLDPAPQEHGITTLADRVARMPLLRPLFRWCECTAMHCPQDTRCISILSAIHSYQQQPAIACASMGCFAVTDLTGSSKNSSTAELARFGFRDSRWSLTVSFHLKASDEGLGELNRKELWGAGAKRPTFLSHWWNCAQLLGTSPFSGGWYVCVFWTRLSLITK